MSPGTFIYFLCMLFCIEAIYVPDDGPSNAAQPVIVHHNYSRVQLHRPNQKSYGYLYGGSTYSQSSRTPKINDNIEQFSQNLDQETTRFDQERQNFDQQTQNVYQESQNFNQQQTQHFDQQNQNQVSHQISDQLGDFTNTHQQSTYSQHVDNIDGKRVFTNAHSSTYLRGKPEKLRQNIQISPKESRYLVRENVEAYKKCPKGATGQYVYELSCNQYLNCWKGRGFVQNCAPGTLFNPETLECDFKDKVSCITGPRQNVMERREPLSAALQAKCPQGFSGIIPHYTDCSKFINCNNGAEIVMDCAPGTLFDVKTNICDFPYKAECVGGNKDDSKLSSSTETQVVVIKPYGRNVSYHLNTQNINDHIQELSRDQKVYSSSSNVGQYGRESKAYGINQQHGVNNQLGEFSNQNEGFLPGTGQNLNPHRYRPDQGSYGSHLNWHGNQTYINNTNQNTNGIVLNPNRLRPSYSQPSQTPTQVQYGTSGPNQNQNQGGRYDGRWAEQSRNNEGNRHNQQTQKSGQSLSPKCPTGASGLFPHPSVCSKFLNCANGITYIQDCGPGTVFNPSLKVCDFPYNVKCQDLGSTIETNQNQHTNNQWNTGTAGNQNSIVDNQQISNQNVNNQVNRNYRMIAGLNQKYSMGLGENYCQYRSGYEAYPQNCSLFLFCDNGRLYVGVCSENMYYNPSKNNCEENASCGYSINESGSGDNQFESSSVTQTNYEGTSNQVWYPNVQYTNFRLIEIGRELYRLNLNTRFCEVNDGFSIHPTNCSRFLLCTNGRVLLGICNTNKLYNPSARTCESNYNCAHVSTGQGQNVYNQQWIANQQYESFRFVEAGNEINILGLNMRYCQINDGFSTHPRNCSKFILCQNGKFLLGMCKPRRFFNPATKTCESDYKCNQQQQQNQGGSSGQGQQGHDLYNQQWIPNKQYESFRLIEAGNEMNILRLDMRYCQINDGFSTHPRNCSKFILCQNGKFLLGMCKPQRFFNPATKTCESDYKCNRQQQQNQDGSSGEGIRSYSVKWENNRYSIVDYNLSSDYCVDNSEFSEHPKNCSMFLYCKNQKLYVGLCKFGLIYNQTIKTCDYTSTCKKSNVQILQNIGTYCVRKQNGAYPHPTDCSKFINCARQKVGIQECASGTLFNPKIGVCDFAQNVNCQVNAQSLQSEDQTSDGNQQTWIEQNSQWLTTRRPMSEDVDQNILTYDQNNKPTNKWPPPFPTTDPNADYVFEFEDLTEVTRPESTLKDICRAEEFHCSETSCIDRTRVCDGTPDCAYGDDEKNCEKYMDLFEHTARTKMAVKENVRYDNFTLNSCAKKCIESKEFICKAFNFRKMDGVCFLLATNVGLSGSLFMLPTYDYYEYKNFTIDCSDKYMCSNRKCIDTRKICDGISDCVDRSDEKGCKASKLGYSVELVGSKKSHEGAVKVTALGKAGYICDDMFNINAANVVCKELGFDLGAVEVKANSYFVPNLTKGNTFYIMDDVVCSGNETSIRDCDFNGWGKHNCMEKEAVGIICRTPEEMCAKDYWKCQTVNECVPLTFVCDGVNDCGDKSDEGTQYCDAPIELRLVDGQVKTEGRVEIKYHGTWGTICDDDFNDDAAKVVCKYLGYGVPARVKKEAYFGQGTGPIWLDQVFCQGNESTLQDCIRWDWGEHNCEHNEDVGVVCEDYSNAGSPRSAKLEPTTEAVPLFPNRCGYRNDDLLLENSNVHFRVVKGSLAQKGQYPWQASLRLKGKTRPTHWCGAVVISSKYILTAAHCLHGYTKGAYIVVAGDYDVNENEGTEQEAYIEEFYIHPDFRKGTRMNNDIALVKLKENGFSITKDVQPICLPDADFMDEAGLNCTISGFGSIQTGKAVASKELRAGWIPIQPSEVCKMPHIYGKSITAGMFCAGLLGGGLDACDGDSGGPLACLQDGLFTLVGLTSWGQHCGEANKPGVYVKISYYRHWIDETMSRYG